MAVCARRSRPGEALPFARGRRNFGGSSIEYMMVLALVVIPIALLVPLITRMVAVYGERIYAVIRWPFG